MALILTLSFLLILFVAYALFYQLSSFIKEKKLRQLQTDFSHALTHDMATPLQTIEQVIRLLGNEKLFNEPDTRKKYISIAQKQIINLQALTDRILSVAKAQKSSLEIQRSSINLRDVIEPLVDKFSIQAKKPVEFVVSFDPEQILMQSDATLLSNAMSNLIDNAVKYSGSIVQIIISCVQKDKDVYIEIADNGYGISKQDQTKVFKIFERGKALMRNEAKGFGLGLSYVKSVVEAHGGTIQLTSQEGTGSKFAIHLPSN